MRQYETAFLIAPNLPEEDNEKLISQMAEVVSKKKGNMINVDEWGKRKLAYPIHKFEEAYYVFFLYEGDPSIPVELERRFKQTETIIRYMTVKNELKESDKKRVRAPAKKKKEAAAVKEEKSPKEKEEPEEAFEDVLKKKLLEKPIEEPQEEQKLKPKKAQEEELKTKSKEESKTKTKAAQGKELKEELKEEQEEERKEELKAEPKEKPEEESQEKLPPEDEAKKEK
jgi:small subunit ribosomal protein S6